MQTLVKCVSSTQPSSTSQICAARAFVLSPALVRAALALVFSTPNAGHQRGRAEPHLLHVQAASAPNGRVHHLRGGA